jgi:hypothetical protein
MNRTARAGPARTPLSEDSRGFHSRSAADQMASGPSSRYLLGEMAGIMCRCSSVTSCRVMSLGDFKWATNNSEPGRATARFQSTPISKTIARQPLPVQNHRASAGRSVAGVRAQGTTTPNSKHRETILAKSPHTRLRRGISPSFNNPSQHLDGTIAEELPDRRFRLRLQIVV